MSLKNHLINFVKGNVSLKDVWYYIQGNIRYKLYYSEKYSKFIRKHIKHQIDVRIKNMNHECYNKGECIKCGCATTALQMASKSCAGACYPKMMNKKTWLAFRRGMWLTSDGYQWLYVEGIISKRNINNNNKVNYVEK